MPAYWVSEKHQLRPLLERRFGGFSSTDRRLLAEARQDQLNRWMERLLDATSPAEVFQSPPAEA